MKTRIVLFVAVITSFTAFSQKKWTLKECVDYALKNNITIKQNKLNVQLAQKDVEIAKGNFLPDLNGSASPGFNFGSSIGQSGSRISADNFRSGFNLNSSTTLFNGFRNLNSYKQAQLGVESSKLDLAKIEDDISLNVVNTYLNVLFAKENLSVAEVQAEISKKQIERAQAQFDAGAIPKGDLLNVQSTAANDIQNVVTQENSLNIALLRLAQLLQVSSTDFDVAKIDVGSPSAALLYQNSDEVYTKALTNRPEIEKAKLNIDNADLNIDLAKGAYLPSLSFSAGAGSSFQNFFNEQFSNDRFLKQIKDNMGYNLGFSLNVPLFNRFQTKNRVAKSMINREQSEFALESEKLQLQQTIEQAFLDAKAAAKTYEAAQTSLEAQNEAFKNAQVSYDYGSMTQFDFDQVRTRLVNAEGAIIRAKYDYVFKTKVLKFYFGESIVD
ncbi:outer membrane protein [Tenacibaculum adriaticum]|uniref:Outer membrane protein n=1 Tax=Tenacibaculum adriaticum TaxID=413713 RepID=A0A5S5DWJ3_9FLAO|nr:TolC family protein [Tenacibaculum adriaticum]TYP99648.1 outer membrane protein [Tenacibaculum adriaticum]